MTPGIPFTVIGGFLGAGKTTLLNRLLRAAAGRRLAVLVNDFGALNIDAGLVASSAGDTIALTNGCVCCSIGGDLSAALIKVLEAQPPFDAVLVEASGVSDPWRIAQLGMAAPELVLDGVIVLVDASAALAQAADPLLADALRRPLAQADLVVLNKTDLVADGAGLQRVRDWLAEAAPRAPVCETVQAELPLALLSGAALPHAEACADPGCGHAHHGPEAGPDHGGQFETWCYRPSGLMSAKVLRAVLRDMPAGVLRLKGIVRTDEHGWAEIQFAGRHGALRPAGGAPAEGAAVVAIALADRLPATALDAVFGAAAAQAQV
ncbi:CobW family GTP-binding protein [Ramlibacter sp. 2FC]|uniref:CobW family GTP-binding protein n=1 Tax=Ramlibacter sp. 2FC TaxID=2502188 RepID=UPI0010F5304A|nr:CobW family GTP-binding protein [Ramlibacter sp. 2FC]